MSCLHPYSDFAVHLCSRWIVSCLVFFLLPQWHAEGQNVVLEFPLFNDSTFACTGIPSVVGYSYCFYPNSVGDSVEVLPSGYNNVYPNQAARFMYSTPVVFEDSGGTVEASFSTFFIFSISHVANQSDLGGGFAFMVAPEISTPDSSASGGFGMFSIDAMTGKASSDSPMVMGIEIDTSFTTNIDTVGVPHIGIDVGAIGGPGGNNATEVGSEFLDTTVGMWVDYNSTLRTLSVYAIPVTATDGSAASKKPAIPIVTMGGLVIQARLNRRSYIGFGAGVFGGGFEENLLHYWTFQTFGFPPESLLTQWYQWWAPLSTTKKIGLIAGAVVGTIGGAYACSEFLFFCFFKRIKNPQTEQEQRWPVRRRDSLPGTRTKKVPPRKKVRDSLSVANPLYLWEAPLEPAEDPDGESQPSPKGGIIPEDDSSNEDTPQMSSPDIEEGWKSESEVVEPIEEVVQARPAQRVERSSRRARKHGEILSPDAARKPVPAQKVPVPPPAKEKVVIKEEKTPSPARRKSEVAKQLSPPAATLKKPSQVDIKIRPTPSEKQTAGPQTLEVQRVQATKPGSPSQQRPSQAPQQTSQLAQVAKPGSPSQQRLSQAPRQTSQGVQAAKPSSPPQQRPPQGAKPIPSHKQGEPQEGKNVTPRSVAPQPARRPSSPQNFTSPARTTAAPQKSQPKGPTPSQLVPEEEPPEAPRSSAQTSPPKAVPRPRPKSPPKRSAK